LPLPLVSGIKACPIFWRCTEKTNYTLYCDESGNSGPNYLEQGQPVHILAGLAVPEPAADHFRALLDDFKARRPQAAELHGVDLMKSGAGQRGILNFLSSAFSIGCLPIWSAAEKRFCIAGRIVETLLDPHSNPRAAWLPTGANETRQNIAHEFYALADPLLKQFMDAYRDPTADGLRKAARSLRTALIINNVPPLLPWTIEGAIRNIAEIAEAERSGTIEGKHFIGVSINFPAFVQFMTHADRLLGDIGAGDVQVVHDQTTEFEVGFKWAFTVYASAKSEAFYTLQSGHKAYFGLSRLRNFRTGNSTLEPEIQGADLLAAALRTIFVSLTTGKLLSPEIEQMARLIFDQRPESEEGNFWIVGPEKFWRRFAPLYHPKRRLPGVA